jgi:MOSC domain-containing protein YiiM
VARSTPVSALAALLASPVRAGVLTWIGLRPVRRGPLSEVASATLVTGQGLEGDHYETRTNGGRQVTLIAAEDLAAIASFLGRTSADPQLLRRNLVTRGINPLALKGKRFRIGAAVLETSGECAPCNRMQETLGPGGYNAVRGRGGITARVVAGGVITLGDAIEVVGEV